MIDAIIVISMVNWFIPWTISLCEIAGGRSHAKQFVEDNWPFIVFGVVGMIPAKLKDWYNN